MKGRTRPERTKVKTVEVLVKEAQEAHPDTATALDLRIADEACALSRRMASYFF
jgi:hypothetical protein